MTMTQESAPMRPRGRHARPEALPTSVPKQRQPINEDERVWPPVSSRYRAPDQVPTVVLPRLAPPVAPGPSAEVRAEGNRRLIAAIAAAVAGIDAVLHRSA
ncbi:hypothetical protein ACFV1N_25165 [Streptosporangium canum]|uniref:hypothetical protein n=1 Tax=Streptosporangium canum TaxID=324952 RepID=UPI003677D4D9